MLTAPQVKIASDVTIAGTLSTAPVWVPVLESVNTALTTLSLIFGVAFALTRIFIAMRNKCFPETRRTDGDDGDHRRDEHPPADGPYF